MSEIYIVLTHISSSMLGNLVWISPDRYEKILRFEKTERDIIDSIRNSTRIPLNRNSVLFYGLRITNNPKVIQDIIDKTDKKLKTMVDPSLSAKVTMIPLDEEQIREGELITKLSYVLIYKITLDMGRKIWKMKSGILPDRSKASLNVLLDKCAKLNFLDDKNITKEINKFRELLNKPLDEIKITLADKMREISEIADMTLPPRIKSLIDEMGGKN